MIACTFGRADAWLGWNDATPDDRPLASLIEVLRFGAGAYTRLLRNGLFVISCGTQQSQ